MSLGEQLLAMKAKFGGMIPPDTMELMHKATNELRASGIMKRVPRVGDRAPSFTLPNDSGRLTSSEEILAQGPMVLSFFRGRW
jgi:hypothetical protein